MAAAAAPGAFGAHGRISANCVTAASRAVGVGDGVAVGVGDGVAVGVGDGVAVGVGDGVAVGVGDGVAVGVGVLVRPVDGVGARAIGGADVAVGVVDGGCASDDVTAGRGGTVPVGRGDVMGVPSPFRRTIAVESGRLGVSPRHPDATINARSVTTHRAAPFRRLMLPALPTQVSRRRVAPESEIG